MDRRRYSARRFEWAFAAALVCVVLAIGARPSFGGQTPSTAESSPTAASECPGGERVPPVDEVVFDGESPNPGLFVEPGNEWMGTNPLVARSALPVGPDVSTEIELAVRATLRQLVACSNASQDSERLYTDDYFRRRARGERSGNFFGGEFSVEYQLLAFPDNAPVPTIEQAWLLPDGRVGAIIVPAEMAPIFIAFLPDPTTGSYLIDEVADLVENATPIAARD